MTQTASAALIARIADEIGARAPQVAAAIRLLDEGNTVPFVARYRKEATEGLDDTALRRLEERLVYRRELEERRAAVLASIDGQGKLTDALKAEIEAADTKAHLEDLYLPYRPRRRTKAQIAREQGLGPLAEALLADPALVPVEAAGAYVDAERGIADAAAALDGARQILMEMFAEDAALLGALRADLWDRGVLVSTLIDGQAEKGAKFADYFDAREPIHAVPSHRALAMLRGRNEGVLSLKLVPAEEDGRAGPAGAPESRVAARFGIGEGGRPGEVWLMETARWAWRVKILPHLETDLIGRLREAAEEEAIRVFALNLKALLLQAPAGQRTTIGLDPGIRTGVKVAVVDETGKLVDTATIHPFAPAHDVEGSLSVLDRLARRHQARLAAIGNGTAGRETERLVADLTRRHPDLGLERVVVNEAGASVYSASQLAADEFPDIDVTLRGAASIARRLQDPLAELVKIDPKSIGVGQYQHDVDQAKLGRGLDGVVEDCVNAVGVEVNTASVALLARVAGLTPMVARNIVAFRDRNGRFRSREALKQVERLGPKAFEQAAGFLRIHDGENPLDSSAVHPEAYPVVERIKAATGRPVAELIGDGAFLRSLDPAQFTDERFGEPTVRDILKELEKPGRDPRGDFKTATFKDGIETLADLKPGMVLEGVVTNVTNFGAFVDIGVHQDGLVHVSALADRFVKDPHTVVKPGDVVTVRVMEVDIKRKRIALSMRKDGARPPRAADAPPKRDASWDKGREAPRGKGGKERTPPAPAGGAMADAFARAARKG